MNKKERRHRRKIWKPIIKEGVCWDWTTLFKVWEVQLKYMEDNWEKEHRLSIKKDRQRIKEARLLCKRIADEDYSSAPWRLKKVISIFNDTKTISFTPHKYTQKQHYVDLDRLFYIMKKYVFNWWI